MNLKFLSIFLFSFIALVLNAQTVNNQIALDQAGFYPNAKKIAIVVGNISPGNFFVIDNNNDTVYKGNLGASMQSKNSSLTTRIADFSNLKKQGSYKMYVPGTGESFSFSIQNNIHHAVAVSALKGFYYMRASMPIEEKYAGKWVRSEGHPDTEVYIHSSAASAVRPEGTKISSAGGWYDAGDYNKYVVNSGISTAILLSAYEDFSSYFDSLKTNIPESADKLPDVLNEAIYNLRWMITMQDPNDGGVYHKCTNAAFDKMIMPAEATAKRYAVQKSTAATLDLAATAAQAARILKKFDKLLPGLSDSCLKAAKYAWQWALQHPSVIYDQNEMNKHFEPEITTGAYGDNNLDDEWFWAACELYSTAQDEKYYSNIQPHISDTFTLPSWSNVQALGYYTLVRNQKHIEHAPDINTVKEKLTSCADVYLQHIYENAFQTVMGESPKDFIWGSNAVAMNQSIVLINAYFITKNKKYIDGTLTNLEYVLGRNATGYCFVTGAGIKSTMHPHHRPSIADGIEEPVPGLLAGGPNPGRQDKCAYNFTEPETAYSDTECAYASNEIAINWNAPLVYVANAMEVLEK